MQITPAMVALWKRGQEILATKAEQKWEEEGGRLVARISCPRLPV